MIPRALVAALALVTLAPGAAAVCDPEACVDVAYGFAAAAATVLMGEDDHPRDAAWEAALCINRTPRPSPPEAYAICTIDQDGDAPQALVPTLLPLATDAAARLLA